MVVRFHGQVWRHPAAFFGPGCGRLDGYPVIDDSSRRYVIGKFARQILFHSVSSLPVMLLSILFFLLPSFRFSLSEIRLLPSLLLRL
jgi:hypothetical protein